MKCQQCESEISDGNRFCEYCGFPIDADGFDDPKSIIKYASQLRSLLFAFPDHDHRVTIQKAREHFKVTPKTHDLIWENLNKLQEEIRPFAAIELSFNDAIQDAYAGHDTYLEFKIKNNADDPLNFNLYWDDPETPNEDDFLAKTNTLVLPGAEAEFGGSHTFQRPGTKAIEKLELTVSNLHGDEVRFKVSPIRIKVGNPAQVVNNNMVTHAQISIEGRGVIDASGIGQHNVSSFNKPAINWTILECSPLIKEESLIQGIPARDASTSKQSVDPKTIYEQGLELLNQCTDDVEAIRMITEAAMAGFAEAQNDLGARYATGKCVTESQVEAIKWWSLAAEQEHPVAQCQLATAYDNGDGVKVDWNLAAKWYRRSAENGFVVAQFRLGQAYEFGQGVEKDLSEAAKWYEKAASGGHRGAEIAIGNCYSEGRGVKKDFQKALGYFNLAALKGSIKAERLHNELLDKLATAGSTNLTTSSVKLSISGIVCETLEDLLKAARTDWSETHEKLMEGLIEEWVSGVLGNSGLATKIREIKEEVFWCPAQRIAVLCCELNPSELPFWKGERITESWLHDLQRRRKDDIEIKRDLGAILILLDTLTYSVLRPLQAVFSSLPDEPDLGTFFPDASPPAKTGGGVVGETVHQVGNANCQLDENDLNNNSDRIQRVIEARAKALEDEVARRVAEDLSRDQAQREAEERERKMMVADQPAKGNSLKNARRLADEQARRNLEEWMRLNDKNGRYW